MVSVAQHISNLLFDHNCVVVPGLGGFVANYQPAKMHPTSYIFNSPSKSIAFNVNLQHNDGLLLYRIISKENIPVAHAENMIALFVQDVVVHLAENKPFKLQHIGRLMKDVEGNIQFIPDPTANYLQEAFGLYSITAEPVLRDKQAAIHHIEKITIRPDVERRKKNSYLLPAAAMLLLALFVFQLFVQKNKNGYDLSEIFGLDTFMQSKTYTAELYSTSKAGPDLATARSIRTPEIIESDSAMAKENTKESLITQDAESIQQEIGNKASAFYIIAGVFGKESYAMTIVDQLRKSKYVSFVIEKNDLFMVAIDIPPAKDLAAFRDMFAEQTGISDAWVMKRK